jgi:hypothetical protein
LAASVVALIEGTAPALLGDVSGEWVAQEASRLERSVLDQALARADGSGRASPLEEATARVRDEVEQAAQGEQTALAGSLVLSTGFSLGYVVWLARGGALLASLASSLPAWATVDPLPVLSRFKGKNGANAEALPGDAEEPEMQANQPRGATSGGRDHAAPGADGRLEQLFGRAYAAAPPAVARATPAAASLPAPTETH